MQLECKVLLTLLITIRILFYLQEPGKISATDDACPAKRRRTATTPPTAWSNILRCVRWETICNMLHWKSEVSRPHSEKKIPSACRIRLDGLLEDVHQTT